MVDQFEISAGEMRAPVVQLLKKVGSSVPEPTTFSNLLAACERAAEDAYRKRELEDGVSNEITEKPPLADIIQEGKDDAYPSPEEYNLPEENQRPRNQENTPTPEEQK